MRKGRKIFYWIITGIFLSIALSSIMLTKEGSINQFYDNGYEMNLMENWKKHASALGQFDAENDIYSWVEGSEMSYAGNCILTDERNYLLIDAAYITGGDAVWSIHYKDYENAEILVEKYDFCVGKLVIPLQKLEACKIRIQLDCSGNTSYKLNDMKLMEYTDFADGRQILYGSAIGFAAYCMVSLVLFLLLRHHFPDIEGIIGSLELQADAVLERLNRSGSGKKYASFVRMLLFVWLVIGWRIINEYGVLSFYGYAVLFQLIFFLLLVSWIPLEREGSCRSSMLLKVWLLLCLIQFISDIFVRKNYGFAGLWIFFCFGLLYRAWGRMRKPEVLLEDFAHAMEILYLLNTVYCFVGNSRVPLSGRLDGTWGNPNPFSNTVVLYLVVMLFRLYQAFREKKSWYCFGEAILGTGLGIWMLWEAECRTSWLAFAGILLVLVWAFMVKVSRAKKYIMMAAVVLLAAASAVFIYKSGILFGVRGLELFNTSDVSSGRLSIWRAYLEQMNLAGHPDFASYGDSWTYAHNGVLRQMYKYGLLAGAAAIALIVEIICAASGLWKKKGASPYTFLVWGVIVAYLIPASLESISEFPMVVTNWFAFYLIAGYLVIQERETEQ